MVVELKEVFLQAIFLFLLDTWLKQGIKNMSTIFSL